MRRRKQPSPPPGEPVEAIALEAFRPGAIAPLVERWSRLPLDHPAVVAFPEYFRGLVELTEGVNASGT